MTRLPFSLEWPLWQNLFVLSRSDGSCDHRIKLLGRHLWKERRSVCERSLFFSCRCAPGDTAKTWPSSNMVWQAAKDDGWISSASRRVPRPAWHGRSGENERRSASRTNRESWKRNDQQRHERVDSGRAKFWRINSRNRSAELHDRKQSEQVLLMEYVQVLRLRNLNKSKVNRSSFLCCSPCQIVPCNSQRIANVFNAPYQRSSEYAAYEQMEREIRADDLFVVHPLNSPTFNRFQCL